MKTRIAVLAVSSVAVLTLAACGRNDGEKQPSMIEGPTPSTAPAAAPAVTEPMVGGAAMNPSDNLVTNASKAPNLTTRVGNYCQIATETGGVTRTQEVVDKAGRKSELNRQKVLKGLELRRDIEASICGKSASRAEACQQSSILR